MAGKITKASSQFAFLSIYPHHLDYSDSSLTSKIKFTPDVVDHLEIIDSSKLDQQIVSFITKNQLGQQKLIIILTPEVYFEKRLSDPGDDLNIRNFIDKIPFDDVFYKIIPDKSDFRLVAFNQDYIKTVKNFFEANGFEIILTLSKFDLDQAGFNPDIKTLKSANLLATTHLPKTIKDFNPVKLFSHFNFASLKKIDLRKLNRTAVLVSFFSLLLIVLVVLIIVQKPFSSSQPTPPNISPTPTAVPTSIPLTPETAVIKITYKSARLTGSVNNLKNQLAKDGFKNVTVQQDSTLGTSQKTYLNFSAAFPDDLKEKITQVSNKYLINSLVQVKDNLGVDVLISAER